MAMPFSHPYLVIKKNMYADSHFFLSIKTDIARDSKLMLRIITTGVLAHTEYFNWEKAKDGVNWL